MSKYIEAGIYPYHLSKQYKKREYAYSEIVKGKKVDYYLCYKVNPDYIQDVFGDDLNKKKISKIERMLGIKYKK